ncbi:MAG: thioredoxin domain-containing protein [Halobacteriales archaeon]|nr:thioredoxin domain-containing protein [Halobacteriales archaeon]
MEPHPARSDAVPRRAVLAGAGALAATALAGCLGGGSGGGEGTADGGTPIADHPAAAGLADQPLKGPDPFESDAVIIAFEDPSCTRCRAFERNTVPQIEAELIEPGLASLAFRGYPVVYEWGGPATHALEATFARDADAFWALKDHYYANQPDFDAENVLGLTREFLAAETGVDADAVVDDVESGATDAAVQADLDAGMNAGAGRTTPTVFLFRDGRYRTKAAGSVSFSVVKNALGL